jgi:branched-chain amino acid transport system substrate-binding protein
MAKYQPKADANNPYHAYGWAVASSFVATLKAMKCPTREGLRDAARNLRNTQIPMLLPGVTLTTGPDDGFPIESMQMMRLKGERWQLTGEVIDTRAQFGSPAG